MEYFGTFTTLNYIHMCSNLKSFLLKVVAVISILKSLKVQRIFFYCISNSTEKLRIRSTI